LWPKRLEKTLWHIRSIGKLSEKTNYVYKTEEVNQLYFELFTALEEELARFGVNYEISVDSPKIVLDLKDIEDFEKRTNEILLASYTFIFDENKKLKDEISKLKDQLIENSLNNYGNEKTQEQIDHLKNSLNTGLERLTREINHVKSSGRLAIPKL